MRNIGIKGRAITLCVLLVLCSVGSLSIALIWRNHVGAVRQIGEHAVVYARAVSGLAEHPIVLNDKAGLRQIVSGIGGDEGVNLAQILGPDGAVLASFRRGAGDPEKPRDVADRSALLARSVGERTPSEPYVKSTAAEVDVLVAIQSTEMASLSLDLPEEEGADSPREGPLGYVRLVYSLEQIKSELAKEIASSIVISLVVIAVGVFVTIVVLRKLLRPVENLVRTTAAIAAGDLDERASEEAVDEIGVLARSFNHMADRLQDTYASIERKVAERTAELETQRKELEIEVAERIRAEESLIAAKRGAEAANRAKSEFLANMSHEIRTPMNGIIGMTELAMGTELSNDQQEYLATVLTCSNSLLTLLNDILDFSKIEAGKMDMETTAFDLSATVEGVIDLLGQRAAKKGIELICHVHPDAPARILGDPARLRQVLVNLAGNAVKFTQHGEVVVSVEPRHREGERGALLFSVRDTGIGIAEDRREKIFESFTQADGATTRRYGGTGLGLTISKQIVELMGGAITLRSELGQGSVFEFEIACEVVEPNQLQKSPAHADRSVLEQKRVMIVDDNATNRTILDKMLGSWGCRTYVAGSGAEAMSLLKSADEQECPIELVVLDVQMPEMDGFEVERRIRDTFGLRSPRIVFLSSLGARNDWQDREISMRSRYLEKPVKQSILLDTLVQMFHSASPLSRSAEPVSARPAALPESSKHRVLLVEDNPVNRKVATGILQKAHCDVTTADNGRSALDVLERASFDMVFMDIQMPQMDGLEATRRLRADSRWASLPIIAMTAHALKGDRERCLEAGMDDYLTKPVRVDELQRAVERWAAGNRSDDSEPAEGSVPVPCGSHDLEPVDARKALDQLGGDRELLDEALAVFVESIPNTLDKLNEAIAGEDAEQLSLVAHGLKGAAASLCAEPTRRVAVKLEQMGRHEKLSAADMLLDELQGHLDQVAVYVNSMKSDEGQP